LIGKSEIPIEWKIGFLTAIHKKESKKSLANYRSITVLPTSGRMHEST
jgi:hypothetical protein